MRYADFDRTAIIVDDGTCIPVAPGNRHFDALIASGAQIAPWTPARTADDVRREASRRMQALLGARDAAHLDLLIANGSREAIRLLRLRTERPWTGEEAERAERLEMIDLMIEAIRAASNALEADPPPDYASDAHWP
ncbi:MAG: hypothetical protein SFW09_21030 [Hyphomicrobiaceae bacterium]|nr:hypothetical protein [Hyphomicrobiaceae bacterium]